MSTLQYILLNDSGETVADKSNENDFLLMSLIQSINVNVSTDGYDNLPSDLLLALQTEVANLKAQLESLTFDKYLGEITTLSKVPVSPIGVSKWYTSDLTGSLINFPDKYGRPIFLGENQIHFLFSRTTYWWKTSLDVGTATGGESLNAANFQDIATPDTTEPVSHTLGHWWLVNGVGVLQFNGASGVLVARDGYVNIIYDNGTDYELQEAIISDMQDGGYVTPTSKPTGEEKEGYAVHPTISGSYTFFLDKQLQPLKVNTRTHVVVEFRRLRQQYTWQKIEYELPNTGGINTGGTGTSTSNDIRGHVSANTLIDQIDVNGGELISEVVIIAENSVDEIDLTLIDDLGNIVLSSETITLSTDKTNAAIHTIVSPVTLDVDARNLFITTNQSVDTKYKSIKLR